MPEDIFGYDNWGHLEKRGSIPKIPMAEYPTMTKTGPYNKNYIEQMSTVLRLRNPDNKCDEMRTFRNST